MDIQPATVIHLDQHRRSPNWANDEHPTRIWDALERNERVACVDEVAALRAALLDHWAELHHLKCRCDLSLGVDCRAPLPVELRDWIESQRADQSTV